MREHLAYILFDPEIESYTYTVANVDGLVSTIADAVGVGVAELSSYVAELDADTVLAEQVAERTRRRLHVKRHLPPANRLGWYVLMRALRPQVAVETGVYHGLGSLVLLRALERNAADGAPGELLSFDVTPQTG